MRKTILALVASIFLLGTLAKAEPLPQGYWTDLLHLGSDTQQYIQDDNSNINTAYLNDEANLMPNPGDEVSGIAGATQDPLVWTALHDDDGDWTTNPDKEHYVKYWHIYIVSPDNKDVRFHYRHDDALRVWNNGQQIIDAGGWDGGDEGTTDATLVAGVNSMTIKLQEGTGGDHMAIRVTDRNDQYFSDLTYSLSSGTVLSKFTVSDVTSGSTLYTDQPVVNVSFDVSGGTPAGYMVTETPDEPAPDDANWDINVTQHIITTLTENEVGTLYGWVKDNQDNVLGAQAQILYNTAALNPTEPAFTVDSATQVTVEWFTDSAAYGKLDYKPSSATEWKTTGWSSEPGTVHTFVLDDLVPGTVYSYMYHSNEITSLEQIYAHAVEQAPLTAGTITVDPYFNAAIVQWQTDAEGYGKVGYGINPPDSTTGYENETDWGSLGFGHSRLVTGLQPGTVYHYAVKANGGDWSSDAIFSTTPADVAATFDSGVDLNQWHKIGWRGGKVAPFHQILSDNGKLLLAHAADGIIAERDVWFKLGNEPAELLVQDSGFTAKWDFHNTIVSFLDGTGRGLVMWVRSYAGGDAVHVTSTDSAQDFADQFKSGDGEQPGAEFLADHDLWIGSPIPGYSDGTKPPTAGENLYFRFIVTDTQFELIVLRMLDSGELVTLMDSGMIDHNIALQGGRFGVGSSNATGDSVNKAWYDNFYASGEAYNPPVVTNFALVGAYTNSPAVTADTAVKVNAFESADNDGTVVGYIINTSSQAPAPNDPEWSPVHPPFAFIPDGSPEGDVTFYGWVLDNDGNVSMSPGVHTIYYQTSPITITDGPTVELSYTQATISWTTDTPVKSRIEWGESNDFDWFTDWETEPTTDHSFTFAIPFKPAVTYHYRLNNGATFNNSRTFTSLSWGGEITKTIYVDANTTVAADQQDGSQAAPFATIMGAVNSIGDISVAPGNEIDIMVAPGTYAENLQLRDSAPNLVRGDKWLKIIATDGRENTIIDCDGSQSTIQMISQSLIDGFTVNINDQVHENICSPTMGSTSAVMNCLFQKGTGRGNAYGMTMQGTQGGFVSNCVYKTSNWQPCLKIDAVRSITIENSSFVGIGKAVGYGGWFNWADGLWFRNNTLYNSAGLLLEHANVTGFHIYNNIFVNKVALDRVASSDLQFYNNTLINANIRDASLTQYVFNNLIVSTGLNSWNGNTVQYQLTNTDNPLITTDAQGRNLIAPSLDSVNGMFVSTDYYLMEEDPENPGNFIQTDQINPDFAKLDASYAGDVRAAGNGLASFGGVSAPTAGIYGVEHGDSTSIGATAVESKTWPIEGDANMDCKVNIIDLIFVRNRLNQDPNSDDNWQADVNGDGKINIIDLIYVRNRLNTKCE